MKVFEPVAIFGTFIAVGLTGCGGEGSRANSTSDNGKQGLYSSSSSSSSSTSSSSSASSSSSSSGRVEILRPLDHVTGLMPYSYGARWGSNLSNYGEAGGGVSFDTVYAAIDAGSDQPSETGGLIDLSFSADQFYSGGQAVERSSLVNLQEQRAWSGGYEGRISHSSRTARTGKFVYEIPLAADKAAVEVHIVPFQDEPYTDLIFSLKVESRDQITSTFNRSNSAPVLPPIQGLTFLDVEVTDGNLTLEFDLPTDYFGVSTIFVSDYKGLFLTCTEDGACQ